ncbi:MAG TPA: GNAT family protein [Stellaceae bacterium]|jgi:RimJ/RimL family protein N-acetyltransferase
MTTERQDEEQGQRQHRDAFGQPIGAPVPGWSPRPRPPRTAMEGRFCRVEPLDPDRHAADLFAANAEAADGRLWTYLPYGPFPALAEYRAWVSDAGRGEDPLFHAIVDRRSGRAVGVASYMRIDPAAGAIEVGGINYSPRLQRTPAATEAMYLMMRRAFDELGYRRYEWKCDSLNAPSRAAAQRLGFRYEGLFRQATIYKGRNRDTTWYSIIDREWPALRAAFERWLDPANFDASGRQRESLSALIGAVPSVGLSG